MKLFDDEQIHERTQQSMMITLFAGLVLGISPTEPLGYLIVGGVASSSMIVFALWWHPGSETIARQWWERESEQ